MSQLQELTFYFIQDPLDPKVETEEQVSIILHSVLPVYCK